MIRSAKQTSLHGGKLVIASHNAGKVREIAELLEPFDVTVVSAGELGLPEPEETGRSFADNAMIKANAAAIASGLPALADDSGLVVPALDGAPGIYSARWAGSDKTFVTAMERVRRELEARGTMRQAEPHAYFVCALALCWPAITFDSAAVCRTFEGRVDGHLEWPPRGTRGFGYDPIFVADGQTQTFGEMDPAIKHSLSHRAKAFHKLVAACFTDSHSPIGLPSC
jgi:XTP/dITP diphosphohydrolase